MSNIKKSLLLASLVLICLNGLFTSTQVDSGFTFVQLCDPQFGGSTPEDFAGGTEPDSERIKRYKQAIQKINALRPDFVVICGDLVQRSSEKTFREFLDISHRFSIPYYIAPGNHDFNPEKGDEEVTPERLDLYRRCIGKDYFAIEHKGHIFVFVNTPLWLAGERGNQDTQNSGKILEEIAKQDRWLHKTLTESKKKNLPAFIIGHHPLNPAQKTPLAFGHLSDEKREELFTLFKASSVAAVLGGHGHRVVIKEHLGIIFVHSQVTSFTLGDNSGWGFRLWHITGDPPYHHEFIPLDLQK